MEMERLTTNEIAEFVAEKFGFEVEKNEAEDINFDTYDWQAGCYHNGNWLCLATIVEIIDDMFEDFCY